MRIAKTISLALVLSVAVLLFTVIPSAASEVPADKYTYELSDMLRVQTEMIEFDGIGGSKEYEVVYVGEDAEIKFTPKEKMSVSLKAFDPDGYYSGNVELEVEGLGGGLTEIEANKTATAALGPNFWGCPYPYYIFSFGDDQNTTTIIYKSSDDTAVPAEEPAPSPISETEPVKEPAPEPVPAPEPAPAPKVNTTYKVQQGDTLGTIALNSYGSYKYHTKIYKANKELLKKHKDRLSEGMELILPADGLLPALNTEKGKVYTVKAGDTLGKIAAKHYGSASKYTKIYEANKGIIKNANLIFEGQKIIIPN